MRSRPKFKKPCSISENEIYRTLIDLYLQSDELSWSRTQTIVTIEAAIIGSAFVVRGVIAAFALVFGVVLIKAFKYLICRDWEIRDQHLETILDDVHKPLDIRLRVIAGADWKTGKNIVPFILNVLIMINIVLATMFYFEKDCPAIRRFLGREQNIQLPCSRCQEKERSAQAD